MRSCTVLRNALALSAIFACPTVAQAQLFRAYLDPSGSDANACTLLGILAVPGAIGSVVATGGPAISITAAGLTNTALRSNGGYAVRLEEGPQAVISGSQMLGNVVGGVLARGSIAPTTTTASVSDSVISGGAYFVSGTRAVIRTMGNNQITDNGGTSGSLTPTALQ